MKQVWLKDLKAGDIASSHFADGEAGRFLRKDGMTYFCKILEIKGGMTLDDVLITVESINGTPIPQEPLISYNAHKMLLLVTQEEMDLELMGQ